jgi:hypothetical protein
MLLKKLVCDQQRSQPFFLTCFTVFSVGLANDRDNAKDRAEEEEQTMGVWHGLPKVSTIPAMPNPSTPCR